MSNPWGGLPLGHGRGLEAIRRDGLGEPSPHTILENQTRKEKKSPY